MDRPVQITATHEPDLSIIRITGELLLDTGNLDFEFTKLNASRPKVIILDLTGLKYCSSLGMGLFVHLRNTLRDRGGRLFMFGAPPALLDSFHRAKLDGLFEIRDSLEGALFSARGTGGDSHP